MPRLATRLLAIVGVAALAVVVTALPASAHVTVSAPGAAPGEFVVITFRVPTESATASTIGLRVQFPTETPLAFVAVKPHPGWTYSVDRMALPTPVPVEQGEVTEAVNVIDWRAASRAAGIKPGEFDEFQVSAGPLPQAEAITFKAIQLYSDGTEVAWIEEPSPGSAEEPEHPAPVLALASGDGGETPGQAGAAAGAVSRDSPSQAQVSVALVLGGLGVLAGLAGLALGLTARRAAVTVGGTARNDDAGPIGRRADSEE